MSKSLEMLWKIYRKLDRIDSRLEQLLDREVFAEDDDVGIPKEFGIYPPTEMQLQPYQSLLPALCGGSCHRIILLRDGYEFDPKHTKSDVLLYQHQDSELTGYPLTLTVENERLQFNKLCIESLTGTFHGGVALNEVGLLFYIKFVNSGYSFHDGNLTILMRCVQ